MESNVDYFIIRENGKIIGAASGEKDVNELNAEITDFAVNPAYRGHGLAGLLMKAVESYLGSETDIKTLYTIARLNSPAMNAVFLKNSYSYSGTLLNNTNISTGIESMNVWYRHI
jgi:putative beta-lysine N-acetyltransferase